MSSRKKSQAKPYWKRAKVQQPAYVREYAYHEDGTPAMQEGFYVVQKEDGTLEYDKEKQIHRDRPNRAMKRGYAAFLRRLTKYDQE